MVLAFAFDLFLMLGVTSHMEMDVCRSCILQCSVNCLGPKKMAY
jgi:hypothetical protein